MLTMYDSVTVANLPAGGDAYAGYTSGNFPTWVPLSQRFHGTGAHLLSIAISPDEHALCLDIEAGDAMPWQAPAWVKTEQVRNVHRPVLYASVSKVHRVLVLLSAAGITRAQVRLWSAHYGAGKHICGPDTCKQVDVGMDGTQWTDQAPGANGSKVDESLLLDSFFTVPPPPAPPPAALDGEVVWYAAGTLHARGAISHDAGKTWS